MVAQPRAEAGTFLDAPDEGGEGEDDVRDGELSNSAVGRDAATQLHPTAVSGVPNADRRQDSEQLEPLPPVPSITHTSHERNSSGGSGARNSFPAGGSTRPTTGGSRTHVPSLTSRAFFAPMSSQRLQAHRGQRPNSQLEYRRPTSEDFAEDRSATNRNSTGSVVTARGPGGTYMQYDVDAMPPMSRGTDYTEYTNAGRTTASNEYERPPPSGKRQESLEPLQQRRRGPPTPLQVDGQDHDRYPTPVDPREKSPRSFMSSFKRSSKTSANGTLTNGHTNGVNGHTNGHARLPSEPSPALDMIEEKKREVRKDLGKNYEYFTGKTVFFWGGRWQNARAKPIVIITGVLIILPSVLFFVFS